MDHLIGMPLFSLDRVPVCSTVEGVHGHAILSRCLCDLILPVLQKIRLRIVGRHAHGWFKTHLGTEMWRERIDLILLLVGIRTCLVKHWLRHVQVHLLSRAQVNIIGLLLHHWRLVELQVHLLWLLHMLVWLIVL